MQTLRKSVKIVVVWMDVVVIVIAISPKPASIRSAQRAVVSKSPALMVFVRTHAVYLPFVGVMPFVSLSTILHCIPVHPD